MDMGEYISLLQENERLKEQLDRANKELAKYYEVAQSEQTTIIDKWIKHAGDLQKQLDVAQIVVGAAREYRDASMQWASEFSAGQGEESGAWVNRMKAEMAILKALNEYEKVGG